LAAVEVIFFREKDGSVPFLHWLKSLPKQVQAKCLARLRRLEDLGHGLRRPESDYLDNGIYELRTQYATMNYRILYFFHGRSAAIVSHGVSKQEARVPAREITVALRRKGAFEEDPDTHGFQGV
jgi:phage-related protein